MTYCFCETNLIYLDFFFFYSIQLNNKRNTNEKNKLLIFFIKSSDKCAWTSCNFCWHSVNTSKFCDNIDSHSFTKEERKKKLWTDRTKTNVVQNVIIIYLLSQFNQLLIFSLSVCLNFQLSTSPLSHTNRHSICHKCR